MTLDITRSLPQAERDKIADEDFAGPHHSFPIDTQAHLDAAAHLIGHADDPEALKKKAIAIARRKGLTLPKAWQEEEKDDGSNEDRHAVPVIVRANGSHAPFKGTHSHAHPAFGSQGGDETHDHEHPHDGDANHDHAHEDRAEQPDILRSQASQPTEFSFFAPIVRVDAAKREVTVRATSEALDTYGTVFDFEGSKQSFGNWYGNIREMHAPKAVGRAFEWVARNNEKAIDVVLRISNGANDTWAKILDGTLIGASVGAKNGVWGKRTIDGEEVPVLLRYDLVELSLVDNPSNPDATIQIIRAAGEDAFEATDVLEGRTRSEEQEALAQPDDTRAGKAISSANAEKMHQMAMSSLQSAKTSADLCGCPACQEVSLALDPDQDGDIDIGDAQLDTDNDDGGKGVQQMADGSAVLILASAKADITRTTKEAVDSTLKPLVTRLNAVSARLAQLDQPDIADITRRLDEVSGLRAELTEVRSVLTKVQETTESYANRASTGGPVVNTGSLRGQYAPQPTQQFSPQHLAAQYAPFVELLIKQGIIRDRDQQVQANMLVQSIANGGK